MYTPSLCQQMSEICVQQICNKKSKLDSDSRSDPIHTPKPLAPSYFLFAASASPSIADLDLRNFFENTILSRHTTRTTKTKTTTTSFVADRRTKKTERQPRSKEAKSKKKRSWALVAGLPLLDPMS